MHGANYVQRQALPPLDEGFDFAFRVELTDPPDIARTLSL
jgi:hypothetical protein